MAVTEGTGLILAQRALPLDEETATWLGVTAQPAPAEPEPVERRLAVARGAAVPATGTRARWSSLVQHLAAAGRAGAGRRLRARRPAAGRPSSPGRSGGSPSCSPGSHGRPGGRPTATGRTRRRAGRRGPRANGPPTSWRRRSQQRAGENVDEHRSHPADAGPRRQGGHEALPRRHRRGLRVHAQVPAQPGQPRAATCKQLNGDARLWSARVNDDYRALLLHIAEQRLPPRRGQAPQARSTTTSTGTRTGSTGSPAASRSSTWRRSATASSAGSSPPERGAGARRRQPPLRRVHRRRSCSTWAWPSRCCRTIRELTTEAELLALLDRAPQLTTDVLFALYDGTPSTRCSSRSPSRYAPTSRSTPRTSRPRVERPATQVTTDDEALQAMLGESFERWQVFLHPTQRKLVERHYNGPARVGGGPGTGKTIVALHRVATSPRQLPPGADKPILLTTFNRNLAADLRTRLHRARRPGAGGPGRHRQHRPAREPGRRRGEAPASTGGSSTTTRVRTSCGATSCWRSGETGWDAEFLADEWTQVILGQVLNARTDYFKARRPGRGRRAHPRRTRPDLAARPSGSPTGSTSQGVWTWRQVAERAARLEMDRAARSRPAPARPPAASAPPLPPRRRRRGPGPQRRALEDAARHVAAGPDDMFLVGDTHQRIYDNHVTLGSLGINIRGRSSRLTLSYRTTRQILATALGSASTARSTTTSTAATTTSPATGPCCAAAGPTFRGAATWAAGAGPRSPSSCRPGAPVRRLGGHLRADPGHGRRA